MPADDKDFFSLSTGNFTIEGRTRAGQETFFRLRELGIAFDIGRCPDMLVPVPHVFVTHAHLDHAAGIPYYAGQRQLSGMAPGRIYIPSEALADVRELMAIHSRLEGTGYDVEIVGMYPGDRVPIGRTLEVRAHAATHRVPSRAYEVIERRHHLKKELEGRDGQELAAMRAAGHEIADEVEKPIVFYTGDTDREILEENEGLFRADVLMIECSFLMPGDVQRAATYRHIHFDDLARVADRFENRLIVLTHFSRRYSRQDIIELLRSRCPEILRERIRVALPEPWQRL